MRASSVVFAVMVLSLAPIHVALAASNANTDMVKFYEDPVFKPLNGGDEHPMADLTRLAEGGDIRAQFILGDLYAKGKGGLVKNTTKGKHWFSQSAINGYGASFIRLAALAKAEGNTAEAYSWYDLGAALAGGKDARYCAKTRDAMNATAEEKDAAAELGRAWRKEKTRVLNDKAAAEKAARQDSKTIEAATKAAESAKQNKDSGKTTSASTKTTGTSAPATPVTKERRYND